jgi:hypothetical protein
MTRRIDVVSYRRSCGAAVAIGETALLSFRIIYPRFMTHPKIDLKQLAPLVPS